MTTTLDIPTDTSRTLQIALAYVDLGWPCFPLEPRGKRPITAHGLHDASTDPDQVARWFTDHPEANIGLATGVMFDVLDIDGHEGFANLGTAMVAAGAGNDIPDGPAVSTGKPGGMHLYFAPTGLGNRAGVPPSVDYRGVGGYVVAAGSTHPNGTLYKFWRGSSDPVFGVRAPLPTLPDWLTSLIEKRQRPTRAVERSASPSNRGAYGRRALENECGRVVMAVKGTRNDTLNRGAFAMGQLVASGDLEAAEAIDALLAAAIGVGLPEDEARATIASGFEKGYASPRVTA